MMPQSLPCVTVKQENCIPIQLIHFSGMKAKFFRATKFQSHFILPVFYIRLLHGLDKKITALHFKIPIGIDCSSILEQIVCTSMQNVLKNSGLNIPLQNMCVPSEYISNLHKLLNYT
ncbi:unnamed protein product [Heterobilharzia americana]|nr:unnamed protein product [Heterobilharzia americana]